jgi:hypothetical protein
LDRGLLTWNLVQYCSDLYYSDLFFTFRRKDFCLLIQKSFCLGDWWSGKHGKGEKSSDWDQAGRSDMTVIVRRGLKVLLPHGPFFVSDV